MILILNTETLKKLDCDFLDYSILKMIYASETKKQACFIGQEKMAEYLGISRQTLNRRLKKLDQKKYLYKSFQYKRVSRKVAEIFIYENYKYALLKSKSKTKTEKARKERNGELVKLFDSVYEKIKMKGSE